ncbi:hypothetical protein ACJJTC_002322 [Scirpophaga incertulas]
MKVFRVGADYAINVMVRYDNFSLYSAIPVEVDQLKFLQNLQTEKYINVIFWTKPSKLHYEVQFIINPSDKELFMERAEHFKLNVTLLQPNIQQAFDNQIIKKYLGFKIDNYTWEYYHTLEDIYHWLSDLTIKYPKIVQLYVIGKSVEGREIYALIIKRGKSKNKIIVEGGIHGREWISVEFVTYLAAQILNANDTNRRVVKLFRSHDWLLIPVANPDGFNYNQKEDRLFKKNRNVGGGLNGVDLNRNFDYSFGKHAVGRHILDDDYCGSTPFSEPETVALKRFLQQHSENLKFYFSIHSYGQRIVIPFADRVNHMSNYFELENYGKQAATEMFNYTAKNTKLGLYMTRWVSF